LGQRPGPGKAGQKNAKNTPSCDIPLEKLKPKTKIFFFDCKIAKLCKKSGARGTERVNAKFLLLGLIVKKYVPLS